VWCILAKQKQATTKKGRLELMIRTEIVKLKSIAGLAYKQKLTAGGTGLTIMTPDDKAVFTINKRDGGAVPYGIVDNVVFPGKVVEEALELTRGLSYKKLGSITKVYDDSRCDESSAELETGDDKPSADVVASKEYMEFIMEYTDKNEKFSYQLMNRDLMKFADSSSVVRSMIAKGESDESITRYIIRSKAVNLAGTKKMDDDFLTAFIETFDSMNTRSAFKELKSNIRGKKSKAKRTG